MFTFSQKRIYYFHRTPAPSGREGGRKKEGKEGVGREEGGKEGLRGEREILKDQYNISSSLTNITAETGRLFKSFINLSSCLKLWS